MCTNLHMGRPRLMNFVWHHQLTVYLWLSESTRIFCLLTKLNRNPACLQVCMNFVKAPPTGQVLSGAADDFGWLHNNGLDAYPSSIFPSKDVHNCGFGADYTLSTTRAPDGSTVPVREKLN